MITICNGIVRSGSTWSYNVCQQIGQRIAQTLKQPFKCGYMPDEILDKTLGGEASDSAMVGVVKAHDLGPIALEWLRTGRAKAICTIRDPRDCVVSDMAFVKRDMDYSIKRVEANLSSLPFIQSFGHTLFVRYEDMMANRRWQISRIASHHAMVLSPATIEEIDNVTNIDASRKICMDLKTRPADQVAVIDGHIIDPISQLHDNHIGNAKTGRWRDELSDDAARELTRIFEPWLIKLGYETERSIVAMRPAPAARQKKRAMLLSAGLR